MLKEPGCPSPYLTLHWSWMLNDRFRAVREHMPQVGQFHLAVLFDQLWYCQGGPNRAARFALDRREAWARGNPRAGRGLSSPKPSGKPLQRYSRRNFPGFALKPRARHAPSRDDEPPDLSTIAVPAAFNPHRKPQAAAAAVNDAPAPADRLLDPLGRRIRQRPQATNRRKSEAGPKLPAPALATLQLCLTSVVSTAARSSFSRHEKRNPIPDLIDRPPRNLFTLPYQSPRQRQLKLPPPRQPRAQASASVEADPRKLRPQLLNRLSPAPQHAAPASHS